MCASLSLWFRWLRMILLPPPSSSFLLLPPPPPPPPNVFLSLSLSLSLQRAFDNVCLIHIAKGAGAQQLPELDISWFYLPLKELFSRSWGVGGAPSPTPISHPRGAHLVLHAHVFAANLLLLQLLLLLLQLYIIYSYINIYLESARRRRRRERRARERMWGLRWQRCGWSRARSTV